MNKFSISDRYEKSQICHSQEKINVKPHGIKFRSLLKKQFASDA